MGMLTIPLPIKGEFFFETGPGYSDFHHHTRLMMELMQPLVKDQDVFDIGCGGGILSVAAALMGAQSVTICDIDPKALAHAKRNGSINQIELQVGTPKSDKPLVLMNITPHEQYSAWREHRIPFSILITSGIRPEARDNYLAFADQQGWKLQKELEKKGWLAYVFKEKQT